MFVGTFLFISGIVGAGYGVSIALGRARPLSYVGMLLAPAGALLAMTGLGRLLNPNFFGG
ncbi:MAG: hypothetical protein SF187_07770 [Deltaproteobacteria bacterium]|nr:hypothetical protein [Deltaproteobacteria bacterium]